jgi:DNA repair exonuclease SbcCD ATPase subunit
LRHGIDIFLHAMDTKPEPPTHLSMEELRDEEMRKLQQSLRETQNRLESELDVAKMFAGANERIAKERDKLREDFNNQAVVYSDRIAALEKRIAELEKAMESANPKSTRTNMPRMTTAEVVAYNLRRYAKKAPTFDEVTKALDRLKANLELQKEAIAIYEKQVELREGETVGSAIERLKKNEVNAREGWQLFAKTMAERDRLKREKEGLRDLLERALPIVRNFAAKNPKHFWRGAVQDPFGAHALTKEAESALKGEAKQ